MRTTGSFTTALVAVALIAKAVAAQATVGPPSLTAGTSPNANGQFTLGWTGADPLHYLGLGYTLEHHNAATQTWSTVAQDIEALSYEFSSPGEAEGTWLYRVQGSDPGRSQTTEFSPPSAPVVVDRTPPSPPSASASRAPDYAGNGGWYKDSTTVSFSDNGDPALADGSHGTGVEPGSVTAPETFTTSGSHTASGTVADKVGNVSLPGTLAVQVDASAPTVEVTCPPTANVGQSVVRLDVLLAPRDHLAPLAAVEVDQLGVVPVGSLQRPERDCPDRHHMGRSRDHRANSGRQRGPQNHDVLHDAGPRVTAGIRTLREGAVRKSRRQNGISRLVHRVLPRQKRNSDEYIRMGATGHQSRLQHRGETRTERHTRNRQESTGHVHGRNQLGHDHRREDGGRCRHELHWVLRPHG